jgi:hypothetical protein
MKIRDIIVEADPAELGPMNPKMRDVLSRVHADDEVQARKDAEAKAKAKEDERAEAARLRKENPEMLKQYIDMLKKHDWTYDYADDHRAWSKGQQERGAINQMAKKIDPDLEIFNKYDPLKKENMGESATAGATSSGSIASVENPQVAYSKPRRDSKGVPKAPQKTKPNGTAVNALDMGASLFGKGAVKR